MIVSTRAPGLLLWALFAVPTVAQDAPKHLLRMAYEVGQVTWYRQTNDMVQKAKVGERAVETVMASSTTLSSEVLKVEGGKASIRRTFTRTTAHMTGLMKVDFDSDDPDSRPGPFGTLQELVGESATMVATDRGRVEDVILSADFPERGMELFGGDLKQMMAQSAPELPDQPIAVGESWRTTLSMPAGQMGEMKLAIDNKLVEVSGKRARLEQTFEFPEGNMKIPGGGEIGLERTSGFTVIDLATGMPVESVMEMVMKIAGTGAMAMNMEMNMKVRMMRIDPPPAKPADKGVDRAAGPGDHGKGGGK